MNEKAGFIDKGTGDTKDKPSIRIVPGLRELHKATDGNFLGCYQFSGAVPIVGFTPIHAWNRFLARAELSREQGTGDL